MGNDIETEKVEKYSANLPSFNNLEEYRKQKQTILYTVLNGSICEFLYIKKILKKRFYICILTYTWSTLFSFNAF